MWPREPGEEGFRVGAEDRPSESGCQRWLFFRGFPLEVNCRNGAAEIQPTLEDKAFPKLLSAANRLPISCQAAANQLPK